MTTKESPVLRVMPLGFQWETLDPFLFCVHHDDPYPNGNAKMGPDASLAGRNLGQDFDARNGWRMYHGQTVPGFPQHPHRGFETVTMVRRGYIDHSDSLGAAARFGQGDVQWLTAGKGIVHAEMFPLIEQKAPNPVELFQIWLNLPKKDKMAEPHFTMLWRDAIPRQVSKDTAGRGTELVVVAGSTSGLKAPPSPPKSWAAQNDAHVAIWTLKMDPRAKFVLPRAPAGVNRVLYFFKGDTLVVGNSTHPHGSGLVLRPELDVSLENGGSEAEMLLLQGRPIGEPVAQHGPFVMNTQAEIQQAFLDYRRTEFGGWRWPSDDPVHARDAGRFARHADGKIEKLSSKG